jgi:2-alkenal reductase
MGISTQTLTPSLAERLDLDPKQGAVVQRVYPDTPAEAAGLREGTEEIEHEGIVVRGGGDLIVAIDGSRVRSAEDIGRVISQRLSPGERTTLTVVRGDERQTVTVTLGERPRIPPGGAC